MYLIFLISIANIVHAENVGIIVEFSDGTIKTDCVNVPSETDGYEILEKSVFDVLWSPESSFGQLACKINGEGTNVSGSFCEFFGDFWNFNILPNGNNEWIHSPVGHNGLEGCWNRDVLSFGGHYCGVDKEVIGYKFGPGGNEPPLKTYEQICEKLKIEDIKIYVDGKKEAGADEGGGKIDAVPGSKLELKIKLENLYEDNENVRINEITVQGILEQIGNGDDIDDEINTFGLNPEKSKEITLKFNIPLEVEENDYDLKVEIDGENERHFPYSKKIEFEVEVDKEKHDVIFNKLEFSNNNIQCDSSANLKVDVVNLGTENEEIKLVISNQEVDINIQEDFELSGDPFDKDNSFSKIYGVKLPADINSDVYVFRADLFYGNNLESSTVELNVECNKLTKTKSTPSNPKSNTNTKSEITGAIATIDTEEKNLSSGNVLMISLVIGEIIVLIAGVFLLIHIFRK